jgi:drug/metabolite transporter (DMT)-like permease
LRKKFLKDHIKAHLAVLAANIFFAMNFSAVQYITRELVQPFALNVLRVGISSILFWLLAVVNKSSIKIKKQHIGRFILCALTGVVINQLLFIKGLSMSLVIHASLLTLVTPIFISFIAAYLLKEKFSTYKIAGLILGISGAVMLITRKETGVAGGNVLLGDIYIIINAISYAFYFVLVKPLMKAYPPMHVIRWVFTLGLPAMLLFGWKELTAIEWSAFYPEAYIALLIIVIGATFLAYSFNLYSIHKLGASVTGSYIYTQPVFATLIAVFIMHESLTIYKVAAAVLILVGVFLAGIKTEEEYAVEKT